MKNPYDDLSLQYVMKACVRRSLLFALSFLLTACLLGGFLLLKTVVKPKYLTTSTVLIYPQNSVSGTDSLVIDGKLNPKDLAGLKEAAGSYIKLIHNRWVLYRVFESLDLALEDPEEFISENVTVTHVSDSPYLNIEVAYSEPEMSYRINQEILSVVPEVLEDLHVAASFAVINYPVAPTQPDMPSTALVAAAGVAGALLLGLLLVLLAELSDSTLRTEKDIRRVLDAECMGFLPRVKAGPEKSGSPMRGALNGLIAALTLSRARVIALTDAEGGPSGWTAVRRMAQRMAELGLHVLWIDLTGVQTETPKPSARLKYVCANGKSPVCPPGKAAEWIRGLMAEEGSEYDFVLIQCPPVRESYCAVECVDAADTAVFLLRHDKTRQDAARRILSLAGKLPVQRVGYVLYDIKASGPCSYYREFAQ